MFFIYYLEDPNDYRKGYIGKTNNLKMRLYKHLWEKVNTPKSNWLQALQRDGLQPTMIVLDQFEDEHECFAWEAKYIAHYRESGYELKNYTDGGSQPIELVERWKAYQNEHVNSGKHLSAKMIQQCDPNGVVIKEWRSLKNIFEVLRYKRETVAKRCKDGQLYKECIWKFKE